MRFLFVLVICFCVHTLPAQVMSPDPFHMINSSYDEQHPVMSPDGKTLFFTIGNHPQNLGGKKDPGDIWFSTRESDRWTTPVHAGPNLNDKAYNAVAGISANGEQLFLHGHYDPSGSAARTQGISISSITENGWSRPTNISIQYFLNKSGIISGTVSDDGSAFIFSAETYGTHGVDDIYISFNENGKWTEPQNLGIAINTQFQELSPSLSHDKRTLYFSSNGRKGNGSFDVYSSTRLDDTWTNWSPPENLGDNINSGGRELYFHPYPKFGYALYTSTINSDGYGDIRLYKPKEPLPENDSLVMVEVQPMPDTTVSIPENKKDTTEKVKETTIKIYGKVLNSKTGEPVEAVIAFVGFGTEDKRTRSTLDGYDIRISSTADYSIFIEAKGFVSSMQKLDINTYEMGELEMNFSLQPVEVGTTVNLKNVLFAQTKADVLPESYQELDLVVNFLNTNPDVRIELSGHTDNRGIHADNVKLSQQRVNKVKEYLVSKGIDARRISGRGYGGTKPIASNNTEESRRMNRRVEFTIKKL